MGLFTCNDERKKVKKLEESETKLRKALEISVIKYRKLYDKYVEVRTALETEQAEGYEEPETSPLEAITKGLVGAVAQLDQRSKSKPRDDEAARQRQVDAARRAFAEKQARQRGAPDWGGEEQPMRT